MNRRTTADEVNGAGGSSSARSLDSDLATPLIVSPNVAEFAVVAVPSDDSTVAPVNHCTLTFIFDPASPTPAALLVFCVRTSRPDIVRVKGGWGQILCSGEECRVEISLRRQLPQSIVEEELQLWVTYEVLLPPAAADDVGDFSRISQKWKEQHRVRCSGMLVSSKAEHSVSSTALWKGRNFDLLNSLSLLIPCRVTRVSSVSTAQRDLLRDQIRLKRAQLGELQLECDQLLEDGRFAVEDIQNPYAVRPFRNLPTANGVRKIYPSIWETWRARAMNVEWMEFVGLVLVVSSTALLAVAL